MSNSPDMFHNVRVSQASYKASQINVQLSEYAAHKLLVDEYKEDMYMHLLALEHKTRPNLYLIQQQPEINLRMRPLLLDFLMDVIHKLNLSKSTFPLTVNIIDRYCSVRIVKKQHYQLLGLTALWIACKNLDSKFRIPTLNDLCKYCCHCYDKKLFLEMENHVLKSLGWQVDAPTFDAFIDMYIHTLAQSPFLAGSRNPHKVCNDVKVVAIYICELIQFYPNIYFNYTSPKIALLSVSFACMIREVGDRAFDVAAFLSLVASTSAEVILSQSEFDQAFALLIKVLKCPPPSLKTKYFNDGSRYLRLMKLLISFTKLHLAPSLGLSSPVASQTTASSAAASFHLTPTHLAVLGGVVARTPLQSVGSTTPKYPATPTLLTISPKIANSGNYDHKRPALTKSVSTSNYASYKSDESRKTLPLPNLLPGKDQGFFGTKRSSPSESAPLVKRSKSITKAVFYIL
ncbi:CIC11C00000005674 [Sungouiella intermedia]|uniref:CIC11C00000005674 n=1 Tax=Sungouiella intermedia TaxID=45354 RepID=A0A1L0DG40_9ASCO|nr:CIC11C00000005674 [[Candida] intermedia]